MPLVSDILSRVSVYTSLLNSGTEQALMLAFVNEIYREAQESSECNQPTTDVALTANDADATFTGTNIQRVVSAELIDYTGYNTVELIPITLDALHKLQGATVATGLPRYYHIDLSSGAGTETITVYPTPDEACTVRLHTISVTSSDLASGDTPSVLPSRFHHRILSNGAAALCYEREGNDKRADRFWARYEKALMELTDWVNQQQGQRVDTHFIDLRSAGGTDQSRDI